LGPFGGRKKFALLGGNRPGRWHREVTSRGGETKKKKRRRWGRSGPGYGSRVKLLGIEKKKKKSGNPEGECIIEVKAPVEEKRKP